ncbi:DUF6502 family protein [uncultured Roseibium sp.]|uniref:DUF6502 family protein n=1 Tax=uncultured Roseibium sp. TaxID=1936171 RepID=UPI0026205C2F|nr:DUF6502 family protein [uncultured Roseibium sp.]
MPTGPKDSFEIAFADLLILLARAMVARGVTIGTATKALKKALVAVAEEDSDPPPNDSTVSVLTGLHRKDVKRLRSEDKDVPEQRSCSAAALVVGYWSTAPQYLNKDNQPRDLPRKESDDDPGFDDLVRQSRIDMALGTILKTLEDQGLVIKLKDGNLRLLSKAFVPTAGRAEQVATLNGVVCGCPRVCKDFLPVFPSAFYDQHTIEPWRTCKGRLRTSPCRTPRTIWYLIMAKAAPENRENQSTARIQQGLGICTC